VKTLLFSGGLDSTVLFHMLLEIYGAKGFCAVSVDYGQPHVAEVDAARALCEENGVEWRLISLRDVFQVNPSGLLLGSADLSVPKETVVKNRNAIFVTAVSAFSDVIFLGCNKDDYGDYYDCRPEYLATLSFVLGVRVKSPLQEMTKSEIVCRAKEYGVDLARVVTCYLGTGCGACASCDLLARALDD
tara:strand:+ start:644 stop:1207 length:564 start_codon:yes stop_codon:yes gene_type:complete